LPAESRCSVNAAAGNAFICERLENRTPKHEKIASRILVLRGQRVLLDADTADLYNVATNRLVQAVRRNQERFPADFMFTLTEQEVRALKSQFVTLPEMGLRYWGRRRRAPHAFSEQGVAMLSSVLRSPHAISMNWSAAFLVMTRRSPVLSVRSANFLPRRTQGPGGGSDS